MEKPPELSQEKEFNAALTDLKGALNIFVDVASETENNKNWSPEREKAIVASLKEIENRYTEAVNASKAINLPNFARQVYLNLRKNFDEFDPQTRNYSFIKNSVAIILHKVGVADEDINTLNVPKIFEKDRAERILNGEAQRILENLGLEEDDLRDKKILDIGAGQRFLAGYCAKNDISLEVYSLDPNIGRFPLDTKFLETNFPATEEEIRKRTVKAKKEDIPLKDNSFDYALMNGVFRTFKIKDGNYLPREKSEIQGVLTEALRILKKNGEARIAFFRRNDERARAGNEILFEILKQLESDGICSVSFEPVAHSNKGNETASERIILRKL